MSINLKSENNQLDPDFIYQYVKQDSSKTYKDFKKEFPETTITESIFSSRKHFIIHKKKNTNTIVFKGSINKLKYEDSIEFISKYLTIDSTKKFPDLKRDFPQSTMLPSTFSTRKRRFLLNNKSDITKRIYNKRKNNSLCLTIWEYPLTKFSDEDKLLIKNIMKNLVDTINALGRVNWQIMELMNPQILELREISK